jgi:hypothetical protein
LTSRHLGLCALQSSLLRTSAKASNLLTSLHLPRQIRGNDALLASCGLNSLPISLLVKRRNSLTKGQVLLALKLCALKTRTLAAKSAALNGLRLLLGKLLPLLLLERLNCRVNYRLGVWVLVVANLLLGKRPDILCPAKG